MFLSINNKLNITLCGMMGSGKSAVGKIMAKKIDYNFIDIDRLIEKKAKKSISNIFEEDGERYFRYLEQKITIDMLRSKKTIVSLGGGAIINKSIRNSIKKNSYNIYLKVSIDVLKKRLENSKQRPLIIKKDLNQTLGELLKKREQFYKSADLVIKNETNIISTVENIIKKLTK